MIELIAGFCLGLVLASRWVLDSGTTWAVAGLCAMGAYLLSCFLWPFRPCWWCSGNLKRGDGRGNYRIKNCWICHGGRYVRLGARLFGRD